MNINVAKTILVVEDDPSILESLQAFFEIMGIEAYWAANGGEALNLLKNLNFPLSLILVDGWLPDMHGLKLIETLRTLPMPVITPNTAVYLFSADSELDLAKIPKTLRVTGIIRKPFEPDDLVELVHRHALPISGSLQTPSNSSITL